MNEMILAGMPDEFDRLAVRAITGEDVEAELAALVMRAREAAGTDVDWQKRLGDVREQLVMKLEVSMVKLRVLSAPQAGLPIRLENARIQGEHAFYAYAIANLNALIETV